MNNLTPIEAYEELYRISRKLAYISSALSLSGWDERTYIPPLGYKHRAELLALLSILTANPITTPSLASASITSLSVISPIPL